MDVETREGIIDTYATWHEYYRDSAQATIATAKDHAVSVYVVIDVISGHERT